MAQSCGRVPSLAAHVLPRQAIQRGRPRPLALAPMSMSLLFSMSTLALPVLVGARSSVCVAKEAEAEQDSESGLDPVILDDVLLLQTDHRLTATAPAPRDAWPREPLGPGPAASIAGAAAPAASLQVEASASANGAQQPPRIFPAA